MYYCSASACEIYPQCGFTYCGIWNSDLINLFEIAAPFFTHIFQLSHH